MHVLWAALFACAPSPPIPTVDGVVPAWGWSGDVTDVEIVGEGFFPAVVIDADAEGGGRVEGAFTAWLATDPPTPLVGVERVDDDRLRAQVPEGTDTGTHALHVTTPFGVEVAYEAGFRVTDTRADHLDLEASTAAYVVGETARVEVRLFDPAGEQVPEGLLVEVLAASATGADGVSFLDDGLEGQVVSGSGKGVRGRLGPDGAATVFLSSIAADNVTLTARPLEQLDLVRTDSLLLTWDPGPIDRIDLALPSAGFVATAGRPFSLSVTLLDALGNIQDDEAADLLLYDTCGSWRESHTVTGSATIEVTPTVACAGDTIHAFTRGATWASAEFPVVPGAHAAFAVEAAPSSVIAGVGSLAVLVSAVDGWGNVVEDVEALVELRDDLGGLDPTRGVGAAVCPGFTAGPASQLCTASLWRSGMATVTAYDVNGHRGSSGLVSVLPGPAVAVTATPSETAVEAGEAFEVLVTLADAYGNVVAFDPLGADPVTFDDDTGTIRCFASGAAGDAQRFVCTLTAAADDVAVSVSVRGLEAELTELLRVVNGVLADVELAPVTTAVEAGVSFEVDVTGWDAWGNPYLVQSDPVVALTDTSGTASPGSITLGADATARASVTVTRAGATLLYAWQRGVELGRSGAISVSAGAVDHLELDVPTWVEAGVADTVTVIARDAWENAVADYTGTVAVAASGAACESADITTFDAGRGEAELRCDVPMVGETLLGDDGTRTATSAAFDVVSFECAAGPVADLDLDGGEEASVCLVLGEAELDLDASGSGAGGSPLTAWHFDDGVDGGGRSTSDRWTATWSAAGPHAVSVLVVDGEGCADVAAGTVWVGVDDGSVTGRIGVTPSASTVAAGAALSVDLVARDCSGDLAAGADVLVRADLGSVSGTSTGSGVTIPLDPSGEGLVTWAFPSSFASPATIVVGDPSGSGAGSATVSVSGDAALPRVAYVSPTGATPGPVSTIEVRFTEAMRSSSLTTASVQLTGPAGLVEVTLGLSVDGRTLVVTPSSPLVVGVGDAWELALDTDVRDVAGNRLDGAWTGAAAPFEVVFGDVTDTTPTLSACTASTKRFTPDGDPGAGVEADEVVLALTSSGAPESWALWVEDDDGERVWSTRLPGAETSVAWSGRGDDGRVVASGDYTAFVAPIDAEDSAGDACSDAVRVTQHVEAP